jgi:importin subunit alpha-1
MIERLVHLMRRTSAKTQLQTECTWAMTNLCAKDVEVTDVVIKAGAIPVLVYILTSSNSDVRKYAAWSLMNIAGDGPQNRDRVLQANVLQPLLKLCSSDAPMPQLRIYTSLLHNLCRFKPKPDSVYTTAMLPVLLRLLRDMLNDEEALIDACWALSCAVDCQNIQVVIDSGLVPRLVQLLASKTTVSYPALRTVFHLFMGDTSQAQAAIDCDVLPSLRTLLTSPYLPTRTETCRIVSNIAACGETQVEALWNAHLFPILVTILKTDVFNMQQEAAWAIGNITDYGSSRHIHHLVVELQVIPCLCNLLVCSDSNLIFSAVESIDNILRHGAKTDDGLLYATLVEQYGGLHLRQSLLIPQTSIRDKARHIVATYLTTQDHHPMVDQDS